MSPRSASSRAISANRMRPTRSGWPPRPWCTGTTIVPACATSARTVATPTNGMSTGQTSAASAAGEHRGQPRLHRRQHPALGLRVPRDLRAGADRAGADPLADRAANRVAVRRAEHDDELAAAGGSAQSRRSPRRSGARRARATAPSARPCASTRRPRAPPPRSFRRGRRAARAPGSARRRSRPRSPRASRAPMSSPIGACSRSKRAGSTPLAREPLLEHLDLAARADQPEVCGLGPSDRKLLEQRLIRA